MENSLHEKNKEVIIFQPSDEGVEFQVLLDGENDTVWVTVMQMVELFEKTKATIDQHIRNIFAEKELEERATVWNFHTVQREGKRKVKRKIAHYNLDVIISVGYRVKSTRATEFRKWATSRLKEYLLQGYSINRNLLKIQYEKIKALKNEVIELNSIIEEKQFQLTDGFLSIINTRVNFYDQRRIFIGTNVTNR